MRNLEVLVKEATGSMTMAVMDAKIASRWAATAKELGMDVNVVESGQSCHFWGEDITVPDGKTFIDIRHGPGDKQFFSRVSGVRTQ